MVVAALVILGVWCVGMSVVILTLVRQVSLISVRLDLQMRLPDLGDVGSGPDVGHRVDVPMLQRFGDDFVAVAITGTCSSCYAFLDSLQGSDPLDPPLVLLLAGRGPGTREAASLVPDWVSVVRDPDASQVGRQLELSRTLVALHIRGGEIVGRATITNRDDLRLLASSDSVIGPHL